MKIEIKNRWNTKLLFEINTESLKICVESAVKINANLYNADLRYADLSNANLYNADLYNADLSNANLYNADLDFSCWPLKK